jgi:acyl-CoA synthetase (AMP-forming)/AMP-acid ligase II
MRPDAAALPTDGEAPRAPDVKSVVDLIRIRADENPKKVALEMGAAELTFERLLERASAIAGGLHDWGVVPGSRVAILSRNHIDAVVATIAILDAGASWIPLNPRDSIANSARTLARLNCDALLFHSEFLTDLPAIEAEVPSLLSRLACLDGEAVGHPSIAGWRHPPSVRPRARPELDMVAAIFQTGGTTGDPKGVVFTHRTLMAIARGLADVIDGRELRYLAAGPLTHAPGRICLGILAMGGTAVILPNFDPRLVLEAVEAAKISFTNVTPTMLYMLLDEPSVRSRDYASLRQLAVGAAPLSIERLKQAIAVFGPVVAQGYGQTEAPLLIAHMPPEGYCSDGVIAGDERLASCGRPTPSSEVRIFGSGPGEIGEIAVRGDFVMDGYLDSDVSSFIPRDRAAFHMTGDLGSMSADGYLTIHGRAKDLIITGGFNVFPAEVERAIMEIDAVRECAVFGMPDAKWGESVWAAVELHQGMACAPEDVVSFARARLGTVKAPKHVVVTQELPRSSAGKVLKSELARSLLER